MERAGSASGRREYGDDPRFRRRGQFVLAQRGSDAALTIRARVGRTLRALRLRVDLGHVDALIEIAEQPAAKIIGADPEKIILRRLVAVADAGQHELVEALVRFDQRV